ncbi:TPA: hypothetical protein O8L21_001641 [Enterobacter cloacae]|uniref:Uncharacterized protein n=1 Tax=Enterobacter sichuanensis TaxID=2071710 RepID=A0A0F1A1Y2_9ENTR|nr:hypothetical protein [Enterobacter sichuanensis]KJN15778.1 hypothetical protein SS37_24015 [Enterobacter sichuanensis]HDC4350361.1 hypothetical protein [Enterobacter cloacae]
MSNIDKRPFRADGGDISTGRLREIADNPYGDEEKCWLAKRVLAQVDELEAAEKRIAELSHHLQCAHAFVEHTEAFGHEASNGILCCGDAQWNIDASKLVLAASGKGEAS